MAKKKTEREPYYSGDKSTKFWKEINAVKNKRVHGLLYSMGVALQNIERLMLNELEDNKPA